MPKEISVYCPACCAKRYFYFQFRADRWMDKHERQCEKLRIWLGMA